MIARLHELFKPTHYKLRLDVDNKHLAFTGTVTISGNVTKPSDTLNLHAKELTITSANINGTEVAFSEHEFDILKLQPSSQLASGPLEVTIEFSGKITAAMHGIYPSNFKDGDQDKKIIATQFESHHAREAFPCIDEPAAKATFDLTLFTEPHCTVLSNTLPKNQQTVDGKLKTIFKRTPRMSTYLLAFVCGEIHSAQTTTKDGTLVRSWASTAQPQKLLEYSIGEAKRILEFFSEYFGTPFPLEKCDQVALPDFDAGAMENWGLVTYREVALLSDPDNRSVSTEQYVSLVVAHELSHQWFGNLVTMQWWDDLWLNESFASIMEHLALDALHPDWQQWEMYTASDVVTTSSRDIFSDVQSVYVEVDNPELIETLFDPAIVYAKGGRLIKMLREYIGDDAFRAGLKNYFKKFAYQNTTRNDLWHCLSEASGKDIEALMDPWLTQSGMPVVTVDQQEASITLSQERFVLDNTTDKQQWPIPLLADHLLSQDVLAKKQMSVTSDNSDYIFLNQQGSGHYLTRYAHADHRQAIVEKLVSGTITSEARITLFNDQILLAKRGDVAITEALELAVNNVNETRDSVWNLMTYAFGNAKMLTEGNVEAKKQIDMQIVKISKAGFRKLGWEAKETEDTNETHLRTTLLSNMIAGEDRATIEKALELYEHTSNHLDTLPADLRSSILLAAVRHSNDQDSVVNALLKTYQNTASADLQFDICVALTGTKRSIDAEKYFEVALSSGGFVRAQDMISWIARLFGNQYTREIAWDYMEQNWGYLKTILQESKSYDFLPMYAARSLTTDNWLKRYQAFFEPKLSEAALVRNISVGINDIKARIAWRQRDEKDIIAWLKNR